MPAHFGNKSNIEVFLNSHPKACILQQYQNIITPSPANPLHYHFHWHGNYNKAAIISGVFCPFMLPLVAKCSIQCAIAPVFFVPAPMLLCPTSDCRNVLFAVAIASPVFVEQHRRHISTLYQMTKMMHPPSSFAMVLALTTVAVAVHPNRHAIHNSL